MHTTLVLFISFSLIAFMDRGLDADLVVSQDALMVNHKEGIVNNHSREIKEEFETEDKVVDRHQAPFNEQNREVKPSTEEILMDVNTMYIPFIEKSEDQWLKILDEQFTAMRMMTDA